MKTWHDGICMSCGDMRLVYGIAMESTCRRCRIKQWFWTGFALLWFSPPTVLLLLSSPTSAQLPDGFIDIVDAVEDDCKRAELVNYILNGHQPTSSHIGYLLDQTGTPCALKPSILWVYRWLQIGQRSTEDGMELWFRLAINDQTWCWYSKPETALPIGHGVWANGVAYTLAHQPGTLSVEQDQFCQSPESNYVPQE